MIRRCCCSSSSNWIAATFSAAWASAASTVPSTSPFFAHEHDTPAALHPTGEVGGGVFLAGAAGRHGGNIAPPPPPPPPPFFFFTIDRWDDATGENLIEQIAAVGDYLVAQETYREAVKR